MLWNEDSLSHRPHLWYNTWSFSVQWVSASLQCFLNVFNSAVVVHKAHKPKFMVVNGDNLYKFFGWVDFACGWVHCSQLMQWNNHLVHKMKKHACKNSKTIDKMIENDNGFTDRNNCFMDRNCLVTDFASILKSIKSRWESTFTWKLQLLASKSLYVRCTLGRCIHYRVCNFVSFEHIPPSIKANFYN